MNFICDNALENIICKMSTILCWAQFYVSWNRFRMTRVTSTKGQWVNVLTPNFLLCRLWTTWSTWLQVRRNSTRRTRLELPSLTTALPWVGSKQSAVWRQYNTANFLEILIVALRKPHSRHPEAHSVIIGSGNGFLSVWGQAIIKTNDDRYWRLKLVLKIKASKFWSRPATFYIFFYQTMC